jgi:nucleoside phosphorylase
MTPHPESGIPCQALVVTALPVEFHAVRAHLSEPREFVLSLGLVAEAGMFGDGASLWKVAVIQVGMGNERAAVETERAISELDPQVVVFVGVAGGIKDVALGDVVVASKVYAYEYGKDAESFRPRAEALEPSYRILNRATAVARYNAWQRRIRLTPDDAVSVQPTALVKPMAAGSRVVGNTRSASAALLREHFSDAVAVEMEGHGFLRSLQAHPGRQALVIRGVSDLIDGKETSDAQGWQTVASATAAAFAFEVLAQLLTSNPVGQSGGRAVPASLGEDFWRALRSLFVRLYPSGPQEDRIWERAGGDPSRLPSGTNARTSWYDAVSLDYPLDAELLSLAEDVAM